MSSSTGCRQVAADEDLAHAWFAGDGRCAQLAHCPSARCASPRFSGLLRGRSASKRASQTSRARASWGMKIMPTPYSLAGGSAKPSSAQTRRKNLSGICMRMPAPSPRVGLRTARAPMIQVEQNRHALLDDFVGLLAFDVDDKANAAGIFFEPGIVQALLERQAICARLPRSHGGVYAWRQAPDATGDPST